jgi:SAM-dependent methyltransferase
MSCVWQQYDDWGERYLDHAVTGTYNALYDRPTVLGLVGDVAGQRVLDAGCGPGLYAEAPASMGADVTAIDASEEQLRIARGRLGDSVRVQRAVLGDPLPFENETFEWSSVLSSCTTSAIPLRLMRSSTACCERVDGRLSQHTTRWRTGSAKAASPTSRCVRNKTSGPRPTAGNRCATGGRR